MLRKEPDEDYEEISLLKATLSKVERHFNLNLSEELHNEQIPSLEVPNQLFDVLTLLSSCNTLQCEHFRRTIISLYPSLRP